MGQSGTKMDVGNNFRVFFFFSLFAVISAQWEHCEVLNHKRKFCDCTEALDTVVCSKKDLKTFPEFRVEVVKHVQTLMLDHNWIAEWPNASFFVAAKHLRIINVEHNPICTPPSNLPHPVSVTFTGCTAPTSTTTPTTTTTMTTTTTTTTTKTTTKTTTITTTRISPTTAPSNSSVIPPTFNVHGKSDNKKQTIFISMFH